jgi:Domain of unknown function (DUF4276)
MTDNVVVVEGDGEVEAMPKLLGRMCAALELHTLAGWKTWRDPCALKSDAQQRACVDAVRRRFPTCARLLITADLEDECPRREALRLATSLTALHAPFPIAVLLFYREYETMFVACADRLAGKAIGDGPMLRTVRADARAPDDPEARRGAKEYLRGFFDNSSRSGYKETVHQALLTAALDLTELRTHRFVGPQYDEPGLPCYRTLERALQFLEAAQPGEVYPRPP